MISEQDQTSHYDGDYTLKEIEFDTGLGTSKPLPVAKVTAKPWVNAPLANPPSDWPILILQTPMGLAEEATTLMKRGTPEITVTVHDERGDSEEEESGSEDDDEYPDKVRFKINTYLMFAFKTIVLTDSGSSSRSNPVVRGG